MKPEERERCIETVASLVRADPDNIANDPRSTFLPLASTRRALASDVFIVLGSRGAGKTALFRLVTEPRARQFVGEAFGLSLNRTQWIRCFAAQGSDEPEVAVLEDLAEYQDVDLRALWACLLVRSIARASEHALALPDSLSWILALDPNDIQGWIAKARASLAELISTLDVFDRALQHEQRTIFCCYDALDRISPFSRDMRKRHLRVLLALWSSLSSRYRAIRAKIFLREDLADAKGLEFPDASKLLARSASLEWNHEDLSRLVVRYLAAHSDEMRGWLAKVNGLELREDPQFGWLPEKMPAAVRKAFTTRLAGLAIGTGIFRVETGRWITGRLDDANHKITPRTVLRFFGRAGEQSLHRARETPGRSPQLLSPEDLSAALRYISHLRVAELRDDYPIVNRVGNLAGIRIPIDRDEATALLARPSPGEEFVPHVEAEGDAILEELKRLGVASVHRGLDTGDVVDIPDIYRFGFGIEVDNAAALQSYMTHGASALHWLQRGELPELNEMLAANFDDAGRLMLEKTRSLYLSGNTSQAISLLENVLSVAQHKKAPDLQLSALSLMAEVVLAVDPRLSLTCIQEARDVLGQQPHLPRATERALLLEIQEIHAYLLIGDLDRGRERLSPLKNISSSNLLFGDALWVNAQFALRDRDLRRAATFGRDLIECGCRHDVPINKFRGYLVLASTVLLTGTSALSAIDPEGLLPWAINLEGIDDRRLRLAILLALAPLEHSDPSSVERRQGEHFAQRLLSVLGGDISLDDMQKEATMRREILLDAAAALVQQP